jgi:HAD superfamily hydrolase (TIGR01509 family)
MALVSRALIFDFDGTIVDTETTLFQAYAETYEAHGHVLDRARWLRTIGTDDGWDPIVELEVLAGPLDPSVHDRRRARRDELIHAAGMRSGVQRWLDDADALGIPVGIASSSPPDWVEHHLDRLGLRSRFSCLACCDGVIPAKPDPTSYRHACETLHADPRRSIAVEDSPHGVAAAKDAGLYVVATPHTLTEALDLSRADRIAASLDEVRLAELVVELRLARRDDGEWLYELHRAAMRERIERVYGPWVDEQQRGFWAARDPSATIEVITVDGRRVGAVHTRAIDTFEVDLIEVQPAFQRAGIGGAVLRQLIARAGDRDVTLQTHKENEARWLYERLGFVVEGETDTHLLMGYRRRATS